MNINNKSNPTDGCITQQTPLQKLEIPECGALHQVHIPLLQGWRASNRAAILKSKCLYSGRPIEIDGDAADSVDGGAWRLKNTLQNRTGVASVECTRW
jgi:hypothetical protein